METLGICKPRLLLKQSHLGLSALMSIGGSYKPLGGLMQVVVSTIGFLG